MSEQAYGSPAGGGKEGGTSTASDQTISAPQDSQSEGQELQGNEQVITPQYLKEMEQRIKEELRREAQSMTDKMGSRLDKEIQSALEKATEVIELGKRSGVKYTPEQEQAIRDTAINSAYANMNQPNQQSSPQSSAPQDQGKQPGDPWVAVGQKVQNIMAQTGVFISPDEANALIFGEDGENQVDPFEYVQAFEAIARQRQLNSQQPTGPSPNIPSLVTGGRASKTQTALRQAYLKERAQIRQGSHPTVIRGDTMGIQNLEIKYRNQGLEDLSVS